MSCTCMLFVKSAGYALLILSNVQLYKYYDNAIIITQYWKNIFLTQDGNQKDTEMHNYEVQVLFTHEAAVPSIWSHPTFAYYALLPWTNS